ncbi:SDR family NAD(P)-dependent oxidoreductase [Bradyrhizobium sp. WSM2254]|uniref:SDR family NAD(P)-dependent oxidoreductase n=1 Tax=Bradyrhizobium sp. WSM2254 TaxID=1188263 RepID=UPI00042500BE|nr:SDR family NAD(P)-dependent oxidoreductase [Bradyrhizobium sp. WSM2254]
MAKKVALVLGAGRGIGGHVAKRFAAGGYHAVLVRRSNSAALDELLTDIRDAGGAATGFLINAAEEGTIEHTIESVEETIGPIEVGLFNLGAQIGNRSLADTPYKTFELGWRLANFGLFRFASALIPRMEQRGRGCLLITTATSAVRGNAGQLSHGAAMGGRRMLAQSLNAEFSSKGIHIANILVDGPVESPDTLGRVLLKGEAFEKLLKEKGNGRDELIIPAQLAETYWHIAHQHRSCWTHEIDVRPFKTSPWWNSNFGADLSEVAPERREYRRRSGETSAEGSD